MPTRPSKTKTSFTFSSEEVTAARPKAIPFPSDVTVHKLRVTSADATAGFVIDLYSKMIEADALNILCVYPSVREIGKAEFSLSGPHNLDIGDTVTVAGTAEATYNADLKIIGVPGPNVLVLDVAFAGTVLKTLGTLTFDMAADLRLHYRELQLTESSGVAEMSVDDVFLYRNNDPEDNTGRQRIIWVFSDEDGTFNLTADVTSDE